MWNISKLSGNINNKVIIPECFNPKSSSAGNYKVAANSTLFLYWHMEYEDQLRKEIQLE